MENEFNTLFIQHERRIHFYIYRLNIPRDLHDDYYAEGMLALWQAVEDYDETKGNIGTFLNHRIRFRFIDIQRKAIRDLEKDDLAREAQQIEKDSGNAVRSTNQMLFDMSGVQLKDDTFWHDIRASLTDNQWTWITHYVINDCSIKEIMELENVSEGAVKSWARQTRKKLRTEAFKHTCLEVIGT